VKSIIFNTDEVRSILDGTKSMFRLPIKQPRSESDVMQDPLSKTGWSNAHGYHIKPKYQVGDIIYCREKWHLMACIHCEIMRDIDDACIHQIKHKNQNGCYRYAADDFLQIGENWQSPATMPREAARLFLRVTGIKVERLGDISGQDCISEGVHVEALEEIGENFTRGIFSGIWDKKHAHKGFPYESNPHCFVYEFERT